MKKIAVLIILSLMILSCSKEEGRETDIKEYNRGEVTNMQYKEGFDAGKKIDSSKPTYDPMDTSIKKREQVDIYLFTRAKSTTQVVP